MCLRETQPQGDFGDAGPIVPLQHHAYNVLLQPAGARDCQQRPEGARRTLRTGSTPTDPGDDVEPRARWNMRCVGQCVRFVHTV